MNTLFAMILLVVTAPAALADSLVKPVSVGLVKVTSLELPIDLSGDYGVSAFYREPKSEAEKFINQGIAALQLYHYLDAFRSFKTAEKLDGESVMAQAGQVLSIVSIHAEQGAFFAQNALRKLQTISGQRTLNAIEREWFEFTKSYILAKVPGFRKQPEERIKPLLGALFDLLLADKTSLDTYSLLAWLLQAELGKNEAKKMVESIVQMDPNNIGAVHSLLHFAENANDAKEANRLAVQLAALAPRSAHAQHMYGHTLPQQGKWKEALAQFQKADALHHAWARKYGIEQSQDWHYGHNLDLLAASHLALGEYDKAGAAWMMTGRSVFQATALVLISQPKAEADRILAKFEARGLGDFVKPLRLELDLSPETVPAALASSQDAPLVYTRLLNKVLGSYSKASRKIDPLVVEEITGYLLTRFKKGGFDGWSNAYLQLLRLKRVAKILSIDSLIQGLDTVEFNARSGALCASAD